MEGKLTITLKDEYKSLASLEDSNETVIHRRKSDFR